jgi:hypothetical protein
VTTSGSATVDFGALKRSATATVSNRALPGPAITAEWFGDDHSRLVLLDRDIRSLPPVLFNFPFALRPAVQTIEHSWNNSFDGFSRVVSPTASMGTYSSARSTEIGYCSLPIAWTSLDDPAFPQGSGLADVIARATDEALLGTPDAPRLRRDLNWRPARFLVHLETNRSGASRDKLCFSAGPFTRVDDLLCSFEQALVAYCVSFDTFPDPARPSYRNLAVEVVEATGSIGKVTVGLCTRQQAVASLVQGITDPTTGVAASMAPLLNDCLWQRELPSVPPTFDGCRFANVLTRVRGDRCDQGDTQAVRDAICARRFPGVRSSCEQRAADDRPVCYWNLEVNAVEMLPSMAQVVLSLDREPGGVMDGSLRALRAAFDATVVGGDAIEVALCRRESVFTSSSRATTIDAWRDAAQLPPPPPTD